MPSTGVTSHLVRRTAVVLVAVLALGMLVSCSSSDSDDDGDATPDETTATPTAETTGGDQSGADQSGGQSGGGGQTSLPPAPPPSAAGPAPTIDSFETPENIDCHNGNFQELTVTWTTTNAAAVVIAIDGPGEYGTYEPNGSTSLPFNCSSSHTFTLTARSADGQEVSTSVTLEPRNVQPPQNGDTPDDSTVTPTEEPDTVATEAP